MYILFLEKKSTMIKRGKKYCNLSELKVNVGETKLLLNQKTTKILKVKTYNLLVYKKQKYRQKSVLDKWYILSNLSSPEKIKKYIAREWELKQCLKTIKLVVTILVSAKANEIRLNNLILLIAISYTISSFQELVLFKSKKLRTKGFKNIYQELMKKVEKKEDKVVYL